MRIFAAALTRCKRRLQKMTANAALTPTSSDRRLARSAAAERMRRHRQRRRNRLRCFTVELRETEIETLIRKGLLRWETRNDRSAIIKALYDFFDHTLNPMP
jgi:hypothetical protein